ncbi:MAG TPA: cyclic nucleotide-binding domain-containing protein [Polyangiaceae bacterium]|jgi:CRP-like cAMP-binding protein
MAYLLHAANVLYLLSYLVKDILWLRLLTVLAGLLLMTWAFLQPQPLWASLAWNAVFLAINVVQSWLLVLERRPVQLSEREMELYRLVFRTLTPREFVKLLALGRWEEAPADTRIVERARALDRLMVIASGRTAVRVGERVVELGQGRFVGEMSFITGEPPTADVVAIDAIRYVAWPKAPLTKFLAEHPPLRAAWQAVLGADLVSKLRAA